jgi:CRISPR/Cas system-associated protein Cas5 (RAMP superfamily)
MKVYHYPYCSGKVLLTVDVAKFYDKRFETIPWDVDRVAESEVKEENVKEVTKKELKKKKKKSFVQRFKGDVNKYTIGMMGLEMEMRLRVEEKRVGVD